MRQEENQRQIPTLAFVLALGGVVGLLDPFLESVSTIRAKVAFFSGVALLLLLPVLYYSRSVKLTIWLGLAIAMSCFMSLFWFSGDHFYLAHGISVPVAAALFLGFRQACAVLSVYAFLGIAISMLMEAGIYVPPYEATDLRRGFVGEAVSVALVAAALTLPTAWRELRARRAISMQLQAEAEAEEERRRIEIVVRGSYGAIVESDKKGRIIYAQGPLIANFGYGPQDLLGCSQLRFVHPEERDRWTGFVERSKESGFSEEIRLRDAQGDFRWVRISVATLVEADGSERYVIGMRNIDEEVIGRQRMEEMARLEGLATMCAGLAHDFNNTLTVFGILFEQIGNKALQRELLQAHSQAAELTAGLLSFAARRDSQERSVNLSEFTQEMRPIIERIAGASVRCQWLSQCPDAVVAIGWAQLQQIFVNLVTNARHSMPSGGNLKIRIRDLDADAALANRNAISPGKYVEIAIADSGIGMSEETLSRAVEPFFTTKPRGIGTGLGLSTTRGAAVAVGGALWIQSAPEEGTTIFVLLPRMLEYKSNREQNAPNYLVTREHRPANPGLHVAVIEDREILASSIVSMLRQTGYQAQAFSSAERFLEAYSSASAPFDFDVILSDIELPGMSGIELFHGYQECWPQCHFVLMSGHQKKSLDWETELSGARFLAKPFTLKDLTGLLEQFR